MTDTLCAVTNCPAYAAGGRKTCDPHRHAVLAKELHIAEDVEGRGGDRCVACRWKFKRDDYVLKKTIAAPTRKDKDNRGHKHVACEPPTARMSKKAQRESVKPLNLFCGVEARAGRDSEDDAFIAKSLRPCLCAAITAFASRLIRRCFE